MSCNYPKGFSGATWALHESDCSLLALLLWPGSHLSLLFITTPGYRGLRPPHGVTPFMVFPTHGYRGATLWLPCSCVILPWRRPILATPTRRRLILATLPLGDAPRWRCLHLALPHLGDALRWLWPRCWLCQRPGTGRYTSPPVLSWWLVFSEKTKASPTPSTWYPGDVSFFVDVTLFELLTWHSLNYWGALNGWLDILWNGESNTL